MEEMTKENEINEIELYPKPYCIKDRCLCVVKQAANGKEYTERLCNFIPWISNEIMLDDGAVVSRRLCVHGIHADGRCLPEVEISSDELTTLNWVVEKWGADCIIDVGRNAKENIRYALQTTAVNAEKKNVYSVTGWKQIGGKWRYLMPGREDITVRLAGKLRAYSMPEEYSLDDVVRVRDMLESQLAPKPVLYSLLAYAFLSPLNEFLRQAGCEPKFVFMLLGKTGTRKSTLAALFLSFFGRFNASELPLSFRDTANSIIMNTFALKDVLTCVDDFHPSGRKDEVALTSTAQSVMRAYGDRTGRARLRADCTPMESRPPQGNAIITAEYPPDIGESGTARYFPIELHDDDVNLDELTEYQQMVSDGVLRRCMFAYTEWIRRKFLQTDMDRKIIVELLAARFSEYRREYMATGIKCHGRVPEITAWLRLGMYMFLWFINMSNVMSEEQATAVQLEFKDIVFELARCQSTRIDEDKPTHIFIRKLYSLIESEQIVVLDKNTELTYRDVVCYEDDVFLYFNKDMVHRAVKKLCEDQGEAFTINSKALLKALAEEKLIDVESDNCNTRNIRIGGQVKRMVCLFKEKTAFIKSTLC